MPERRFRSIPCSGATKRFDRMPALFASTHSEGRDNPVGIVGSGTAQPFAMHLPGQAARQANNVRIFEAVGGRSQPPFETVLLPTAAERIGLRSQRTEAEIKHRARRSSARPVSPRTAPP